MGDRVTTTELAGKLNLSKGRISQMVSKGQLAGCYDGDGRARRFDLSKVAEKLSGRLDPGQLMGNGSQTKRALRDIAAGRDEPEPKRPAESSQLTRQDPDRYELARTQKVEEEARRLRRQNAEDAGRFVLASSVEAQVRRQMAKEVAQFETMLRDGARRVADELGVDYLQVRRCLLDVWRAHRGQRSDGLAEEAAAAAMSDDERDADF
ncbi:hypothetical protein KO516_18295 [Citreicella sp. C3M06]|uniref:hypothetical protein n=1 Tax=Citreicella sp. C3M06 TaxID=2841564 RepID=UPI001C08A50C|nr:hypothetical protein [Citreicella sp. C3M06]MBU2962742.1 hypothetical protein [Citreicella sp. C3M06]